MVNLTALGDWFSNNLGLCVGIACVFVIFLVIIYFKGRKKKGNRYKPYGAFVLHKGDKEYPRIAWASEDGSAYHSPCFSKKELNKLEEENG